MIYLNTIFENLSICIRPVSEKMPLKIYKGLFKCFTKKINVSERKEILKLNCYSRIFNMNCRNCGQNWIQLREEPVSN